MRVVARFSPAVLAFALLAAACQGGTAATTAPPPAPTPVTMTAPPGAAAANSFRERVFYELWVRSFQDSDGDGIGDLPGLIDRLDELADLGVGGIWLMPIYPSPLADSGYDVADYTGVHPDYGTLEDLDALIAAAHARGILVYLDMVFNHTSDQHTWFQAALTGPTAPTFGYYVWAPEPGTRCSDLLPGTPFGSNRWTWVDDLNLYYFHQFYPRQPDLNFRNPALQEALLDVLRFWMARGVDGFRFDVPDRFFENGDLCTFQPETRAFHARLRETISGTGRLDRGFVGEIWGLQDEVKPYFGPDGNPMIFDFERMVAIWLGAIAGASPRGVAEAVALSLQGLPSESRWGVILGNHDTPRIRSLPGAFDDRLKLAAALQMTTPGVPFVWMGEELGLDQGTAVKVDWRDGARAPYPWSASEPGLGFTTAATPHLAFADDAAARAWDLQRSDGASILNYYRRLIALRNAHPALRAATLTTVQLDDHLWAYRMQRDEETLLVAHNFSRSVTPSLDAAAVTLPTLDLMTGERFTEPPSLQPGQTRILTQP